MYCVVIRSFFDCDKVTAFFSLTQYLAKKRVFWHFVNL